ncbi:MAG: type IV toxin-antitoxin system AbiEi family antitoxin domain-containing protein [Kiritimatiellae bacterium]|nr:type IV toxin-antitoxin system AbiEi family antitoxin domain-containing protein [Kiritimatiellia bacterium]
MSYYDQIYDETIGNNGIITSRQAIGMGIPAIELVKLCHRGKLTRIGHGVYRIDKYFPQETDAYAAAVAKVGEGSYIIGESVLGFYRLCPTHEAIMHVGTSHRVRRRIPQTIQIEKRPKGEPLHWMDGVPAQTIGGAIRTARRGVEPTRLREAILAAQQRQLIQPDEALQLMKEVGA